MNTKKLILAALVAFAAMFIVDGLWFEVIFKSYNQTLWDQAGLPAANDSELMHALATLFFAFLLAWIYPMGYKGGTAMNEGIKFGLWMGLVYQLPGSIHWFAALGGSPAMPCFLTANGIVNGIIGGICIAKIYGGKSAAAAS